MKLKNSEKKKFNSWYSILTVIIYKYAAASTMNQLFLDFCDEEYELFGLKRGLCDAS